MPLQYIVMFGFTTESTIKSENAPHFVYTCGVVVKVLAR